MHRSGWCDVLLEGFTINTSYVTLYDFEEFNCEDIFCKIFSTNKCHWRTVPAVTNTFACRYKTLIEDLDIHKKYSSENAVKVKDGYHYSKDYDKFWELQKHKKYAISSIPGWSTHCDANYTSPVIDWEQVMNETYSITNDNNEKTFSYS